MITGFLFDRLPVAPSEIVNAHLSFDWATMTEDNFAAILMAFGDYWAKRGAKKIPGDFLLRSASRTPPRADLASPCSFATPMEAART